MSRRSIIFRRVVISIVILLNRLGPLHRFSWCPPEHVTLGQWQIPGPELEGALPRHAGIPGRENMMTSSNGNIFRVTGPLCGEFTGHRWIPHTKASDAELWCFLWSVSKRLSKQPWDWWFETPSRSLWRHRIKKMFSDLLSYIMFEQIVDIY